MGDEIRDSTNLANSMNDTFDSTAIRLKSTMNRMLRMAEKTGISWKVWLGFFAAVILLFWYVWLFWIQYRPEKPHSTQWYIPLELSNGYGMCHYSEAGYQVLIGMQIALAANIELNSLTRIFSAHKKFYYILSKLLEDPFFSETSVDHL